MHAQKSGNAYKSNCLFEKHISIYESDSIITCVMSGD